MGDFASSLKKAENQPLVKDKVTGFFLTRKDESLQKEGSRRITVSAPDALFKRIEAAAKERGLSKNAFILSLVHKELDE